MHNKNVSVGLSVSERSERGRGTPWSGGGIFWVGWGREHGCYNGETRERLDLDDRERARERLVETW